MKQLLLLLVLLFSYIIAEDDNSIELKSSDFDMITSKGTWFVKHYVPWCKHCKKLAPFWSQMSRDFAYLREKRKFFMAQINCDKEVELCKLHDIDAYPTLLLYKDGVLIEEFLGEVKDDKELKPYIQKMAEEMFLKNKDTPVENKVTSEKNVSNPSDKDKEKKEQEEIEKKEKEEKEKEKEEKERKEKEAKENKDSKKEDNKSKETTLENSEFSEETLKKDVALMEKHEKTLSPAVTGSTFEHILSKGYTFVKYYAPWCGHCIHFRPTWLSLSHELSSYKKSKNLQMVQFDCDAESDFCRDHGVTGYPSLKLYKDGELIKGFTEFDRSLNNVKKWLLQTIEDEESGRMTIKKENKEKGSIPVEIQNVLKIDEKSEENINNGAWFVAFILKKGENDIDPFDEKWGVLAQEFEKFKDNYNTQLAYVDCGVDYELCKKYKVKAQVEIKLYLNGNWVENYSNSEFDMESIRVYIREKTSLISQNKLFANYYFKNERISNPDGKLMELNSENYELLVPTGNYFILFKTASCIKCKAIHSILQELAPDFVNSVNLATIYCDKNHELCQKLKVEKYPKLKYFKDGNPRDYHGLPNKEAINSFIISSRK
ncbi:thioredoxin-like protein [Neoconidiobolus thromboides FSU 785]|nr:thioredoxin-like protein [Neoconidiobolus thromboides FSU 785]